MAGVVSRGNVRSGKTKSGMAGFQPKKGGMHMVYQWKEGARISFPAQVAGRVCAALEEQNALTAQRLVDESRPEDAPLHAAFEWNDTIAAEEWRKHTARHIINSLVIREEAQAPVRAFFNIRAEGSSYQSIHAIIRRPDKMDCLLGEAYAEMEVFRRKYAMLEQLRGVMDAIDESVEQHRREA